MSDTLTDRRACLAILAFFSEFSEKYSAQQTSLLEKADAFHKELSGDGIAEITYATSVNSINLTGAEVLFALKTAHDIMVSFTNITFEEDPVQADEITVGKPEELPVPEDNKKRETKLSYVTNWRDYGEALVSAAVSEEEMATELEGIFAAFMSSNGLEDNSAMKFCRTKLALISTLVGNFKKASGGYQSYCEKRAQKIQKINGISGSGNGSSSGGGNPSGT